MSTLLLNERSLISTKQKSNVAHVDLPKLEFQEVTLDILPPHFFA